MSGIQSTSARSSPRNVERPQGFEDAKLAKRGLFRCTWGCDKLFRTKKEACDHPSCHSRRETYEDLVEMNRLSGNRPPIEYLEEVQRVETLTVEQIENSSSVVATPVLSEPVQVPNPSSALTEELVKTLPKRNRMDYVAEWLNALNV